ncbi:DUF3168 domain-containing protein [Pseudomonas sp. PCH199]|uniref:tail completion protein gp17 n=1 Tax=unclassified Pseudomonas TaxID=196821 RepID=UPI000BDACFC8|nr:MULTISPECIES: DUF3168 domain-containing protein [unclassified Pseudomonas]MCW8278918.1 DUF3168 domain-containing protein [Pseudomonas sp. PCH199]PAM79751.1 hypothetical protein CES87_28880 [Pseudomonas sp. ERMR1:02]
MPAAPIFAVCAADAGTQALLGVTPHRLYPFGEAPEGVAKPYAVWQLITGSPENYLAGRADIDGFTLQVDVYAVTATSARSVTDAIARAIELKAYVVRWGGESKDTATKLYWSSFDIDWLVPR